MAKKKKRVAFNGKILGKRVAGTGKVMVKNGRALKRSGKKLRGAARVAAVGGGALRGAGKRLDSAGKLTLRTGKAFGKTKKRARLSAGRAVKSGAVLGGGLGDFRRAEAAAARREKRLRGFGRGGADAVRDSKKAPSLLGRARKAAKIAALLSAGKRFGGYGVKAGAVGKRIYDGFGETEEENTAR